MSYASAVSYDKKIADLDYRRQLVTDWLIESLDKVRSGR